MSTGVCYVNKERGLRLKEKKQKRKQERTATKEEEKKRQAFSLKGEIAREPKIQ